MLNFNKTCALIKLQGKSSTLPHSVSELIFNVIRYVLNAAPHGII